TGLINFGAPELAGHRPGDWSALAASSQVTGDLSLSYRCRVEVWPGDQIAAAPGAADAAAPGGDRASGQAAADRVRAGLPGRAAADPAGRVRPGGAGRFPTRPDQPGRPRDLRGGELHH